MSALQTFIEDIQAGFNHRSLAFLLGWQDIRQRYRRSKLGPFWLTISMGVMIGMIGLVFGQVFKSPMQEYLPFLASGIILWTYLSSCVMEGASSFIDSVGMIRQLSLPLSLYPARSIWRNTVILGHNILILPLVFLCVGKGITWEILWVIPGFALFVFNVFWFAILSGTICARFRDLPQIINSLLQVFFYITPVIWMPNAVNPRSASLLMDPNPMYHLIEIVRAPLLGYAPSMLNWMVAIVLSLFSLMLSVYFYGNYKKRIAYWL